MKVLVTGASGFVGSRTCLCLKAAGHHVLSMVRGNDYRNSGSDYVADVTDPNSFSALESIDHIDAIVHCAGLAHRFGTTSKDDFQSSNIDGVRNVAEFAVRRGVGRLIHLSSVLVYERSDSDIAVTETGPLSPDDEYARSKVAGELIATEVCARSATELVILRPAPIIGEGSKGNVARLIRAIDRDRFRWIGDGRNRRSFVYVGDVARAIQTSLEDVPDSSVFNVVGGVITVKELVDTIAVRLGKKTPPPAIPRRLADISLMVLKPASIVPAVERYRGLLETWFSDAVYSGEAFAAHGFRALTTIEQALQQEVDHYLENR